MEHAFGRFKARGRRPLKRSKVSFKIVPQLAFVSAILHNIVEERGEVFWPQWLKAAAAEAAHQKTSTATLVAAAERERLCQALWDRRAQ